MMQRKMIREIYKRIFEKTFNVSKKPNIPAEAKNKPPIMAKTIDII